MRGILEPDHLLLILLVVVVLFGGKKIPELAGGLGKGIREFKRGIEEGETVAVRSPSSVDARSSERPDSPTAETVDRAPKRLLG